MSLTSSSSTDPDNEACSRLLAADTSEPINEELKYMFVSNVKVSNFVSVKLLDKSSYSLWKEQMLCLLDSQNMGGLVDARFTLVEVKSSRLMEQYKSLVKGWIYRSLNEDMLKLVINSSSSTGGGLQEIWSALEMICAPQEEFIDSSSMELPINEQEIIDNSARDLKKRVQDVLFPEQVEVTTALIETPPENSIRDNKLVKAVVDGRWLEAKRILQNNKDVATESITNDGHTMLHIAVLEGRNNFLERLLDFIDDENKLMKVAKNNWGTALRCAAFVNNKRAAQLLVKKCKHLLFSVNGGLQDLIETAFDEKNLDTFLYFLEVANEQHSPEAIIHTEFDSTINFDILEDAIYTKQYALASRLVNVFPQVAMQDDRLLMAMARTFPTDLGFGEAFICPSLSNFHLRIVKRSFALFNAPGVLYAWADDVLWATRSFKEAMWLLQEVVLILIGLPVVILYPLYGLIRLLILVILYPFFMLYFLMWKFLAIAVIPIKRIEKKTKKYQEAKEFLNIICDHIDKLGLFDNDHPCYSKPFLEAVSQGAYEVVDEILSRSPDSLGYSSEDDHSFIQLAITNRSDKIYNLIFHLDVRMGQYRTFIDSSENNILHLAGRLAPEHILSRTTGAALQLQRDLQWFQEVERLMLPGDLLKKNADMQTPHMVFSKQHAYLVKEGEQWIKTTSEACSITAALIVTIVFAAAITVPGGNDQEKGTPLFKKEIAFIIFAVCDAISLFSAASSLLVFLSILTTRFAEKDFLVSLPRRLIIGLCTLFLSTIFMMVAFSAILFLVFCDKRPWMLAPIGGLTCMPIAVIVTLQLPLLIDLFKSTYIPIFGKQKYIAGGKFISKHPTTIYAI